MFAVGKPSVRPRLSPSTTSPSSRNGAPRQRVAAIDLAGRDQGADPARGHRLAVDLDAAARRGSRTRRAPASISVSPRALAPKRKFSPTETFLGPETLDEHPGSRSPRPRSRRIRWSNGITTSSSTPRPSITSRLISNGMISFGAASGCEHPHRVRLEREHRVGVVDHLAVAEVDAVEGPDRDVAIAALGVGSWVTLMLIGRGCHSRARTTSGRSASPSRSADRHEPAVVGEAQRALRLGRGGEPLAVADARGLVRRQRALGQERQRLAPASSSSPASSTLQRPDRGAPQPLAVGVARASRSASGRRCPTSTRSRSSARSVVGVEQLGAVDRRPRARGVSTSSPRWARL